MKKVFSLVMVILMLTLLAGCSKKDKENGKTAEVKKEVKDDLKLIKAEIAPQAGDVGVEWEAVLEWLTPIGTPVASSFLKQQGKYTYFAKNVSDNKLETAWVEGKDDNGIGESISFKVNIAKDENGKLVEWGDVYQFNGKCYILNGVYSSQALFKQNSRVKKFRVYYNDRALCYVELLDKKDLQTFSLVDFFFLKRSHENKNAIRVKNGDMIRFEIVEVYEGSKYKDTAVTELLGGSAGN